MISDRTHKPQKFRQIPLRLVLVLPFVLQIVGAVGLVGYLSYRSGQQAVKKPAAAAASVSPIWILVRPLRTQGLAPAMAQR